MRRRRFIISLVGALMLAGPAFAETVQDRIVAQLGRQGFDRITISTTFLGRVRIVAQSATQRREIIFNPRTGEILRDYWAALAEGDDFPHLFDPNAPDGGDGHSGAGDAGDDDDDDDDDAHDDDDGDDDDDTDDD